MEAEEYKSMFDLEEGHWWYRGLRGILFTSIQGFFKENKNINILDAGCGTGFNITCLQRYGRSFGIDISKIALNYCQKRGLKRIAQASIVELPFRDGAFDLVVSTDVLYHMLVEDDNHALSEIYRVLKKDGILVINIAAHNFLWRRHDQRVHARHRYAKNELYSKLRNHKFKIIKISYRNVFLFFVLFFLKLVNKQSNDYALKESTELKTTNNLLNPLFYGFLAAENLLLKKINIPVGSSLFSICQK